MGLVGVPSFPPPVGIALPQWNRAGVHSGVPSPCISYIPIAEVLVRNATPLWDDIVIPIQDLYSQVSYNEQDCG